MISSTGTPPSAEPLLLDKPILSVLRPKAVAPLHNLPRRPTISTRTLSSPPLSPASKSRDMAACRNAVRNAEALTPPTTPIKLRRTSSANQLADKRLMTTNGKENGAADLKILTPVPNDHPRANPQEFAFVPAFGPREFASVFTPILGSSKRPQEYGRGVWSMVYKAILSSSPLPSPPNSPGSLSARPSQALAIKAPLHRGAEPVLYAEATLLTYLSTFPSSESHIVPFHGYQTSTSSIVLSAIPLTLITYVNKASSHARANFSTRTMFEPVLGTVAWLHLARQLISTLSWLHNTASVVHADIKPGNILLQPASSNSPFPYSALITDFSSSFLASSAPLSSSLALTTSFAAPELLTKNSTIAPTKSSDVYSLACTLLAAATGDILIYPTQYEIQRLAMAREGKPLDFVRMGNQGTRVRKGGVVERVVSCAVGRDSGSRIEASEWLSRVEEIMRELGVEP
jgi:hypothetical protein